MIRAEDLAGSDGDVGAVRDVTLSLPSGTIYGLIGTRAADRSVLLQLLATVCRPDGGALTVLGYDAFEEPVEIRRRAAFLPRERNAFTGLRALEFLRYYLGFFPGSPAPDEVLAGIGLDPRLRLRDATPSGRTRLLLGAVLARPAELLLLDQPTEGLDPAAAEDVLSTLVSRGGGGRAGVVVASDRIDEVERVSARVGILLEGRLVVDAPLDDLLESWRTIWMDGDLRAAHELAGTPGVRAVRRRGKGIAIVTQDFATVRRELGEVPSARIRRMSLREIYMEVAADGA